MAKYVCMIQSGLEGLTIADLFIRGVNGEILKAATLQKGEELPIDLFNKEDFEKSLKFGSLKKCLDRGWIVDTEADKVEKAPEVVEMREPTKKEGINELEAGLVKPSEISNPIADSVRPVAKTESIDPFPKDTQPKVVEIVSKEDSVTPNTFAVTEEEANAPTETGDYEKFKELRYFQKLKMIKETENIELLKEIIDHDDYPQLTYNSKTRLKDFEESK